MATRNIFPTANAVDHAFSDTVLTELAIDGGTAAVANGDIAVGAVAALNPGDTLFKHYDTETSEGSGTGTGVQQDWVYGDTGSNPTIYIERDGATVGGSFAFDGFPTGATVKKGINVERAITIKGNVDGSDVPTTTLTHDSAVQVAYVLQRQYVTLEDLLYKDWHWGLKPVAWHPCKLSNIRYEGLTNPANAIDANSINMLIDNRITYGANLDLDPYYATIENCHCEEAVALGSFNCSGLLINGCSLNQTVAHSGGYWDFQMYIGPSQIGALVLSGFGDFNLDAASDIVVDGFDVTTTQDYVAAVWINSLLGGTAERITVKNSSSQSGGWFANENDSYKNLLPFLGPFDVKDIEFSGNTCEPGWYAGPVFEAASFAQFPETPPIERVTFADNTISRAGSRPAGAFEVYGVYADNCRFIKNDYTGSKATGIAAGGVLGGTHIFWQCTDSLVFETGGFPGGLGGSNNFVSLFPKDNNRVIGLPANELETPRGIGTSIKEARVTEQDTFAAHAAHRVFFDSAY